MLMASCTDAVSASSNSFASDSLYECNTLCPTYLVNPHARLHHLPTWRVRGRAYNVGARIVIPCKVLCWFCMDGLEYIGTTRSAFIRLSWCWVPFVSCMQAPVSVDAFVLRCKVSTLGAHTPQPRSHQRAQHEPKRSWGRHSVAVRRKATTVWSSM